MSYISGGTYSLKATPNDRFFWKLFMAFLFTLRLFARNLLNRNSPRKYFLYFFMSSLRLEPWLLHLISQHTRLRRLLLTIYVIFSVALSTINNFCYNVRCSSILFSYFMLPFLLYFNYCTMSSELSSKQIFGFLCYLLAEVKICNLLQFNMSDPI